MHQPDHLHAQALQVAGLAPFFHEELAEKLEQGRSRGEIRFVLDSPESAALLAGIQSPLVEACRLEAGHGQPLLPNLGSRVFLYFPRPDQGFADFDESEVQLWTGRQAESAKPGELYPIPEGIPYAVTNNSQQACTFFTISLRQN